MRAIRGLNQPIERWLSASLPRGRQVVQFLAERWDSERYLLVSGWKQRSYGVL